MPQHESSNAIAWIRVIALALAAFIFNTTEFAPVGLLSDIAMSFKMDSADAGLMITIYAWLVTLSSLPMVLLTGRIERRKLLAAIFLLFIASHILSAMAWSFAVLLISRLGIALAHAVFWSITVSLAIRVAPEGRQAQALGLLSSGSVLAMVAGVPLGRMLGQWMGWRVTFLAVAILAALTLCVLLRTLPRLPSRNAGSLASLPALLRRPALTKVYLLTALAISAHFTAYSYIEPFVQEIAGHDNNFATVLLLLFGGAGILGSLTFARLGGRHTGLLLSIATGLLATCMALLLPLSASPAALSMLGVVWGMTIMLVGLGLQTKALEAAPDATDLAMSLLSGIYNIGIGGGALLGSVVSQHAGMEYIGQVGALIGLAALLWSLFAFRHELPAYATLTLLARKALRQNG